MRTLYWHDYETWGADPRRSRPAQFAGIRTDEDLNIVGDPLMIYCRPAPDFLPDPVSCAITGITPQTALDQGLPEAEFCTRIWQAFMQPGTCGVGYNSIRFDDEVTRHLLYRCLYDAYGREWKNGNSRWDLIDLVRMTHALRPEGIQWPKREDGFTSFKLEELTVANGIGHDAAHDALSDVHATIGMARLIRQAQPRLYQWYFDRRFKKTVQPLLDPDKREPVVHISGMYGAERGCLAVVIPLMRDPVNNNGVIVYDLSCDPATWRGLDAEQIRYRLFTPRAELPEGIERIPLKTVHANKCPALAPLSVVDDEVSRRWGIDLGQCRRHLDALEGVRNLEDTLAEVFRPSASAGDGGADPDFTLYGGGFFSQGDRERMHVLHSLSPQELAGHSPDFQDPRLHTLYFRFRARNWPETLNAGERSDWQSFCAGRLRDGAENLPGWTAFREMLGEAYGLFPDRAPVLDALNAYAEALVAPHGLNAGGQ